MSDESWPVRQDYKGIGYKQLENKMSKKDEAFDNEVDVLQKMGRFDMVGSVGKPPAHYAGGIEPIKFIRSHGMDYATGAAIKYLVRYKYKGEPKQDLLKARAYIDLLLEDFGGA
jgi:hypothetical protein